MGKETILTVADITLLPDARPGRKEELEQWFEGEHYPEMYGSGHFLGRPQKFLSQDPQGRPRITYVHGVVSGLEGLEQYKTNNKPALGEKFTRRWDGILNKEFVIEQRTLEHLGEVIFPATP